MVAPAAPFLLYYPPMKESDNLLRERAVLRDARRVVVKVGTHSIAKKTGRPAYAELIFK